MANVPYDGGVPSVAPDTRPPDDTNPVRASAANFGGAIGAGLEKAGEGIGELGKFYQSVAVDDQVNKVMTAADGIRYGQPGKTVPGPDGKMVPDMGFLGKQGADALQGWAGAQKNIDDTIAEARKNLSSPAQQLEFDTQTRRLRSAWNNEIGSHADRESKSWFNEVNNAGAQHAVNWIASHADDPTEMAHGASDLINFRMKDAQVKYGANLSDDVRASIVAGAKQEALAAQVNAIGAKDPARAMQILDKNKDIAGVQFDNLSNALRARADQQTGIAAGQKALQGAAQPTGAPGEEGRGHQATGFHATAAGASGYGLINAPYLYPLERKGEKGIVSPAEHYSYLKAQGASNNEALMLTGAAANESSFNATAVHDGGNGYGLYGHNHARIDMRGMSWQQQASAALNELRRRPEGALVNSAQSPDQLALAEMHFEAPRGFTSSNPMSGDNYTGRLNTLRYFQQMNNGVMTGAAGAPHRSNIPPEGVGAGPDHPMYGAGGPEASVIPGTPSAPQVPGAPPPSMRANAYQTILNNPDLSPEARQHALTYINQTLAAQQIAADEDAKARKAANDKAADGYVKRMLTGQSQGIVEDIANDPNLTYETRRTLGDAALKGADGSAEGDTMHYGAGFWKAYKAVTAPVDDPSRIADVSQLLSRAGPGGDLTLSGVEKLSSIMGQTRRSVNDAAVHDSKVGLMNYAKGKLSFDQELLFPGVPPLKDPKGEAIFNGRFIPKFEAAYDKWTKDGKDPWAFLTQENVDKFIAGMRPQSEMNADKVLATGDVSAEAKPADAPAQPLPPPPAGVDPGGWTAVMQAAPLLGDGKQWPAQNWAAAVNMLRANPTPDMTAKFDAKFGAAGITAKDVLGRLAPPKEAPPAEAPAAVAPPPAAPLPPHAVGATLPHSGAVIPAAPAPVPATETLAPITTPKPGHGGLEHPTRNPEPQKPANPQPLAPRSEQKSVVEFLEEALPGFPTANPQALYKTEPKPTEPDTKKKGPR